jgi:protein SCO1/2/putative membrane protein
VLRSYAQRYGASPDRWWFLTGPKPTIYDLIREHFHLGVVEAPGPVDSDSEAIVHSDRLALIDRGRIVGLFESNDSKALDALLVQARRRALPAWVRTLPTVNAGLNGLSACLLVVGWILIRRHRSAVEVARDEPAPDSGTPPGIWGDPRVRAHIGCMVAAVCTSALFLACYLYYHSRAGSMPFSRGGPLGVAYFSILLSHTLLATLSVPLIFISVRRAWAGRIDRHVTIASVTLPIWLYVAVTGVVIYAMLYHLPVLQVGVSLGL